MKCDSLYLLRKKNCSFSARKTAINLFSNKFNPLFQPAITRQSHTSFSFQVRSLKMEPQVFC